MLHWAARRENFELCKLLLLKGAELDVEDYNGLRPLDYVYRKGNFEIAKYFISEGSDPFVKKWNRRTKRNVRNLIEQIKWVSIFFFKKLRFGLLLVGLKEGKKETILRVKGLKMS